MTLQADRDPLHTRSRRYYNSAHGIQEYSQDPRTEEKEWEQVLPGSEDTMGVKDQVGSRGSRGKQQSKRCRSLDLTSEDETSASTADYGVSVSEKVKMVPLPRHDYSSGYDILSIARNTVLVLLAIMVFAVGYQALSQLRTDPPPAARAESGVADSTLSNVQINDAANEYNHSLEKTRNITKTYTNCDIYNGYPTGELTVKACLKQEYHTDGESISANIWSEFEFPGQGSSPVIGDRIFVLKFVATTGFYVGTISPELTKFLDLARGMAKGKTYKVSSQDIQHVV